MFSENDRVIHTDTGTEGIVYQVLPNGTIRVRFNPVNDYEGTYQIVQPSALELIEETIATPPPSPKSSPAP